VDQAVERIPPACHAGSHPQESQVGELRHPGPAHPGQRLECPLGAPLQGRGVGAVAGRGPASVEEVGRPRDPRVARHDLLQQLGRHVGRFETNPGSVAGVVRASGAVALVIRRTLVPGGADPVAMFRRKEGHEEVVLDHVHGHLAAADGPADEGHHEVPGVVQQELVAGARGNLVEAHERVGRLLGLVAGQPGRLPVGLEKELGEAVHLRGAERIHDGGLVDDRRFDGLEAVPEALGTRCVVGPPGGAVQELLPAGDLYARRAWQRRCRCAGAPSRAAARKKSACRVTGPGGPPTEPGSSGAQGTRGPSGRGPGTPGREIGTDSECSSIS
jgi:hypothetical protein